MDGFTGYVYAVMWFALAVYMFYLAFKETKFLFVLSAFFLYSSVWSLCNELIEGVDLYAGIYSWIYRGVATVVLVVCIIAYLKYKQNRSSEQ